MYNSIKQHDLLHMVVVSCRAIRTISCATAVLVVDEVVRAGETNQLVYDVGDGGHVPSCFGHFRIRKRRIYCDRKRLP